MKKDDQPGQSVEVWRGQHEAGLCCSSRQLTGKTQTAGQKLFTSSPNQNTPKPKPSEKVKKMSLTGAAQANEIG